MTELQTGLIGLGAVVVVVVLAYNKWQEYRHRKLAEEVLNVRHTDVLLDERMQEDERDSATVYHEDLEEDVFDHESLATTVTTSQSTGHRGDFSAPSERIEPVFRIDPEPVEPTVAYQEPVAQYTVPEEPVTQPSAPTPTPPAPVRQPDETRDASEPHHLLSPVIDYVVAFEAVEPVPAYQLLEAQRSALARIRKPIHWIGYNEYSREWEPVIDDGQSEYRRIRVGLQLVDRKGALSDGELSVFHVAMQDLSDELMAIADFPPRQPALDSAARLDKFCADVDIQVGINVVSQGQMFAGTKLRALAEAAGMVIDGEGRFVRFDDDGNVLFVLLNQDQSGFSAESMKTMSTHGLTFLLDVPRVSHGERVFNQMVDLARRFADVLRGALVDDNHRPLSEGALEPIRRQVGQYQATMAAQGLAAGGPLARRLFS